MRASTFLPRSFMSHRSFSKAISISLSTHQLVREAWEQQSNTLSLNRIPRVDLLVEVVTWEHLVLVEPAANAASLQLVVQAVGEGLIDMAVANKAGVELEGAPDQRFDVGDEVLRHTNPSKEDVGNIALRAIEGIDANGGRSEMDDCL
jgi:hypothetical protein